MTFTTQAFNVSTLYHLSNAVLLHLKDGASSLPKDLKTNTTVYLTTDNPAVPRTSDMQDIVDRCERIQGSSVPNDDGWRIGMETDLGCRIIDNTGARVAAVHAQPYGHIAGFFGEKVQHKPEHVQRMRQNVALIINAQRMFNLLRELTSTGAQAFESMERARALLANIEAQQPTQG